MHKSFLLMSYYGKPRIRSGRGKYSNETTCFNTQIEANVAAGTTFPVNNAGQADEYKGFVIVPATNVYGTRKVKNFTIRITAHNNDSAFIGALVYVPEGTKASPMSVTNPTQSLYAPQQNVICTFMVPSQAAENDSDTIITVSSKLARNLSSGDSIMLVLCNGYAMDASAEEPITIMGTVNYAIKF